MPIELDELRQAIRGMSRRSNLYQVLKEELTRLDHWKQKRRGRPGANFVRRV